MILKFGDRVTVEDAPSYWSWASPFTVEAIDGEMAKFQMMMAIEGCILAIYYSPSL